MTSPSRVLVASDPLPILTAPSDKPVLLVNRGAVDVFLGDSTVSDSNNSSTIPPLGSIAVQADAGPWYVVSDSATPVEVEVVPGGLYYGAGAVEIAEQLLSSGILVVDAPVELDTGSTNLTSAAPQAVVTGYIDISRYSTLILRVIATNDASNNDNTVIAQAIFYADTTSGIDYGFTVADVRTGLVALGLEIPARAKYVRLVLAWTQREGTANHTVTATWRLLGSFRQSSAVKVDRREPTLIQLKNTNFGTTIGVAAEFLFDSYGGNALLSLKSTSAAAGTWTPSIECEFYSSGTQRTRTIWTGTPFNFNGATAPFDAVVALPRKSGRLMLTPSATVAAPGITELLVGLVADPAGMQ